MLDKKVISGTINTWYILSGKTTITSNFAKGNDYNNYKKMLMCDVTVHGLWVSEDFNPLPSFILPTYSTPIEFCRWGSDRFFSLKDSSRMALLKSPLSNNESTVVWKGYVSIFDKERFSKTNETDTLVKLNEDICSSVQEGLSSYCRLYHESYESLFKKSRELLKCYK